MAVKKTPAPELHPGGLPLDLILQSLPAAFVEEAVRIAVERMDLTPSKLADIMLLAVNPAYIMPKGREAELRGVRHETLKGYKDAKLLPELVNGK